MKKPEEILKQYEEIGQIVGIDKSVIIFNDALSAMNEYADLFTRDFVEWVFRNFKFREGRFCHLHQTDFDGHSLDTILNHYKELISRKS